MKMPVAVSSSVMRPSGQVARRNGATAELFHANAIPEGIELRPGDRVLVHGAPDHVAFGERISFETTATVYLAGAVERLWTRWSALLELTELYHCGFEPKELAP